MTATALVGITGQAMETLRGTMNHSEATPATSREEGAQTVLMIGLADRVAALEQKLEPR